MAGRIQRRSPPSQVAAARRDGTRGEPVPGRHEVRARPLALVVLILVTVGACAPGPASPSTASAPRDNPIAGVEPATAAVMRQYGHAPAGPTRVVPLDAIGDIREQPWSLYLEVSRQVGLDFGALRGAAGALEMTPLDEWPADAVLVVLRVDGRPVGAWIGPGGNSSGVLPADARP